MASINKVFLTYSIEKNGELVEEHTPELDECTNVTATFRGYSIMELLEDEIFFEIMQHIPPDSGEYEQDGVDVKFTTFYIGGDVFLFQKTVRDIISRMENKKLTIYDDLKDVYTVNFHDLYIENETLDIKEPDI